jgi:TfoX/Sxy family transcriptional regulator of competence genes
MEFPKPAAQAAKMFEELTPTAPGVVAKKMFGQPAAFLHGNMFFGVFGEEVFVRLSEADRSEALRKPGFHLFEPMPGRPMSEYVVLPRAVLADRAAARKWLARSVDYASHLPAKKAKTKGR